jgi:hypothetical protein
VTKDADLWGQALCGLAFDYGLLEKAASRAIARAAALESEVADLEAKLEASERGAAALRAAVVEIERETRFEDGRVYELVHAIAHDVIAETDAGKGWLSPEEAAGLRKELFSAGSARCATMRKLEELEATHAKELQAERERVRELCVVLVEQLGCHFHLQRRVLNEAADALRALDLAPPTEPQKAAQEPKQPVYTGPPTLAEAEKLFPGSRPATPEENAALERATSKLFKPAGPPYIDAWLAGGCMVCGSTERGPGFYTCLGCCSLAHRLEGWNAWVNACIQAKRERESGGGR